ncbi:MAG TPA: hypothetical protein VH816_05660 [Gaiellaceae bacterium]
MRGDFVAGEADDSGGGEPPEVGEGLWVDEALDRLDERDHRADEDRGHDGDAAQRSPRALRRKKASPSGIAVSASPKLWIKSARSATLGTVT